uniref:Uncharacterized protein n=1 Tax=Utricularia reniformis TaxID=192314 RepID=A0A1Y0B012_9LAMI|nr:hypothetical protein AEK19_MT0483 [Utricularia reniformis]ART30740.1 hypothetical protein AEK19_MT0483 [Utricularia reniformis]
MAMYIIHILYNNISIYSIVVASGSFWNTQMDLDSGRLASIVSILSSFNGKEPFLSSSVAP